MKKAARQILFCAAALVVFCIICRLTVYRDYSVYVSLPPQAAGQTAPGTQGIEFMPEDGSVLRAGEMERKGDTVRIRISPEGRGKTWFEVHGPEGETMTAGVLQVGPLNTVYNYSDGSFTGDNALLIAVTVFFLYVGIVMARQFFHVTGPDFYSYVTIFFAGFSIFSFSTFLMLLRVTVFRFLSPQEYNMLSAYSAISGAGMRFMFLTLPAVVFFSLAMAVSNITLLRHEKPRLRNVLGLGVSALLIAGEALGMFLAMRSFSGSEWEMRIATTIENVYATSFAYFECILAGAVICALKAAKNEPAPDKDFIVILGCWFRKDGSLPPLLKGRADRALAFYRKQKEATGKEAVMIPSGGQGRDESMPEAEAIARYLRENGVPPDKIILEDRAANTYENMSFSAEIIRHIDPEGKAVFVTTNYHVFRSGLWASLAGFRAEGIGGKTVWWFWPNAFIRECAGLLKNRWKQEILLLIFMVLFFGTLSMVLE